MRCDAKLFICAQLRMCAEDGESQTLMIISAIIRMSALKNILEGLQLAQSDHLANTQNQGPFTRDRPFCPVCTPR